MRKLEIIPCTELLMGRGLHPTLCSFRCEYRNRKIFGALQELGKILHVDIKKANQ